MASPRIFISSTCYDLKHIRESLKYFVSNLGYEPVLSDDGDVFYNPSKHTHESCIDEVSNCQMFVLIIGGRYGGKFQGSSESITNEEYRIAFENNIPVFTLVDSSVLADHHLYQSNSKNDEIDRDKVNYPASDNIKIFEFINEVRTHSVNNAINPFSNFLDIETYLRKQWAGMLFDFLLKSKNETQAALTNSLLSDLTLASKKTEELLKFVYKNLDAVNADEVINTISETVNAKKFVDLVLGMTKGVKLDNTNIERLINSSMETSWYQYLVDAADFFTTEEQDDHGQDHLVLWPPTEEQTGKSVMKMTNGTVGSGHSTVGTKPYEENFLSLKALDAEKKKEVLENLLK
jgi:hypothetical protein